MDHSKHKGIVVFSGGSAANSLVDVFGAVRENRRCPLSYVIPISDNGGSSSELIRVFGGPGRLVRLIPDANDDADDSEKAAIKVFFNHRLPKDRHEAKKEWLQIVEANHPLWTNISSAKKELIRSFLNMINFEIMKRLRPSSTFNFSSASIGNLFLTGARLFSGSFESAIYLLSSICRVPDHTSVIPAINTNFTHHISASLADGTTITGQNSISHPSPPQPTRTSSLLEVPSTTTSSSYPSTVPTPDPYKEIHRHTAAPAPTTTHDDTDTIEDANPPGTHPTLRQQNISFSKTLSPSDDLPARISRIWYINPYGAEIRLSANPRVLSALNAADAVIYSIGSLYTSLIPSLILKGVGEALANPRIRWKILILNALNDRETGPSWDAYTAVDFVAAIAKAAAESRGVLKGEVPRSEYKTYVTHMIHLTGPGTPRVDKEVLSELGIECVRVYGRKLEGEEFVRYDEKALVQALEVLMGRGKDGRTVQRSRRNTSEG
ncbi:UPF0052-domain-containing protein [Westerdykella ornata]|uniref:UPF0052-domain-containing protein n=1 Tax=Westerdykella ornata TaxID=318751 RepID=A0A6A6JXI9_WESOR|nr:UPF0052-domain-containing protein [Westerdykella ornata]KAF2281127.1 UPF0052-domain-containing protein [Westerdykella ornata]